MAEAEMKVVELNGDNNKKMLPKDKKESWEWKYVSTGRHLVRMHWLTNFVKTLFIKTIMLHQKLCLPAMKYP